MRNLWLAALLLTSAIAIAGTLGGFRGVLYKGAETRDGWWYVAGQNHSLRLVNTGAATVTYGAGVSKEDRQIAPSRALKEGCEVRVTAEQDSNGIWQAREIEIIRPKSAGNASGGSRQH